MQAPLSISFVLVFVFILLGFKVAMADYPDRIEAVESCLLPETVEKGKPMPFMKLTDRMEFCNVPGVSIAVINNYSVEWAKGYGVRENRGTEPVTADTLFQAASISKPHTFSNIF